MKRFFKDRNGSALIWSLFIILILFTLSFVIYSAVSVYSKYQMCENELQRAATITMDKNMENANVRDVVLDIPADAISSFESNLLQLGYIKTADAKWTKTVNDSALYCLDNLKISIEGEAITVTTSVNVNIPWKIANKTTVSFPIRISGRVLYLDA